MAITYTFAGLPVSDYAEAYDWYSRLLGRAADTFPHGTEAVWRLTPHSAIYVVEDRERAGRGLVTVAVDHLGDWEQQLRAAGIPFDELLEGEAPRRLMVRDGDGNTIAFFEGQA